MLPDNPRFLRLALPGCCLLAFLGSMLAVPVCAAGVTGVNSVSSTLPIGAGGNVVMYVNSNGTVSIDTAGMNGALTVNSNGVGGWAGYFTGTGADNGIVGLSNAGIAVYGASTNSWGGVFSGANGVLGTSATGWGGYFSGANGVLGTSAGGWGGYFTGASGVYGISTNGVGGLFTGITGLTAYSTGNGWAATFQGNAANNGPNGIYAQGTSWAGFFNGPVQINGGIHGEGNIGLLVYAGADNWAGNFQSNGAQNGPYGLYAQGTSWAGYFNGPAGGTSAWANFSDGRLKMDVETIPGALDKIMQLRGVYYHWIDPKKNAAKGRQIGVVAQEVEKVFPEAVLTDTSLMSSLPGGTKMVTSGDLVAPLIEAVKEQQRQIEKVGADNDNLRHEFEVYKKSHP
jgi:trimeric autotransporter adhesin